ncbi:MAG: YfhO family protein, partial [Limisphaerales bacterium]
SLGIFCLLHLWFGGLGMFFLTRRWLGNPIAAAFAAVAFTVSGVALSCLIWPNYCVALGWMPWLMLAARRAWLEGGIWIPTAALAGTMQMLVGAPEFVMLTWLFLFALWLCDRKDASNSMTWLVSLPAIVALITALSAAQLLPFFDLLENSQRHAGFQDTRWPMPIWGWANLFVPLFHYGKSDQGWYLQQGQFFLSSYHLGLAVMMMAIFAVWRQRNRFTWLLTGATLLVLILALGHKGLLYTLWLKVMPGGGVARYPVKFMLLAAFTVPLLAGVGIKCFLDQAQAKDKMRFKYFTIVMMVMLAEMLIIVVLAHWFQNKFDVVKDLRLNSSGHMILMGSFVLTFLKSADREIAIHLRKIHLVLALAFVAADLLTHMPKQNPTVSAKVLSMPDERPVDQRPVFDGAVRRAMIVPGAEQALLKSKIAEWDKDIITKRLAYWSNLNLIDKIPKVNGSMTLRMRHQDEVQSALYPKEGDAPAAEALKDFLCVAWQTHPTILVGWTNRTTALPLVTAGQSVRVSNDDVIADLISTNFNPRAYAWIAPDGFEFEAAPYASAVNASTTNLIFGLNQLQFEVNADAPTVALIAQSYNQNWRAMVNDKPANVWRANHAFQAVEVPAGKSFVRLDYIDDSFRLGVIISGVSGLLCLGWLGLAWRRRRTNA